MIMAPSAFGNLPGSAHAVRTRKNIQSSPSSVCAFRSFPHLRARPPVFELCLSIVVLWKHALSLVQSDLASQGMLLTSLVRRQLLALRFFSLPMADENNFDIIYIYHNEKKKDAVCSVCEQTFCFQQASRVERRVR